MPKCLNCGVEVEDGAKFCGECGIPIPQVKECPQCHAKWPIKAKFCGDCGYNFALGVMPSVGSTLLGTGNTIAGSFSNNVSVTNSGNVSNVVSSVMTTNVVNNVVTNMSADMGDEQSHSVPMVCEIELKGVVLCIGRKKFSSIEEIAKMDASERKRYRDPRGCQECVFAFGPSGEDSHLTVSWKEDGELRRFEETIDCTHESDSIQIISQGAALNDFKDGEFGLFVSKDVGVRLCASCMMSGTFNPALLTMEYQSIEYDEDLMVVRKMTYDGVSVTFEWRNISGESEVGTLVDSWIAGQNEQFDYNVFSDEQCTLLNVRVSGTLMQIGSRDFDSASEMNERLECGIPEELKRIEGYSEQNTFLQCEGAIVKIEDALTGSLIANERMDPMHTPVRESEAAGPIKYAVDASIFDRDEHLSEDKGRVTLFLCSMGWTKVRFFCFGRFDFARMVICCRKVSAPYTRLQADGTPKIYERTVLDQMWYSTPSCGKCFSLTYADDEFTVSEPFDKVFECDGSAIEKRFIRVEEHTCSKAIKF